MPGIGVTKRLHILNNQPNNKEVCLGGDKFCDLLSKHS